MNTMNPLTGLNAAAERHQAARADRWRRRSAAVAASLPNWRTEARTRLLIRIYLGSLAFGLIIGVVQVFWRPALFAWLAFTVVMLVAWTMLRTVINTRDVAPDEELDEYEQETIRNWQAIAYGWLVLLAIAVSAYMIILGTSGPDDLSNWIYTGGLFSLIGLLALSAMPTIAYATTFGPVPPPEVFPENSNNR
ncbi:hypothetical protein [Corynebacterium variabile]|uniref:hypothetical protein n=1 Tax=Corynebacterium variabile TaxID=1727 RepID=UPI003F8EC1C0